MGTGERVVGLVETGRVPKLRRIEDAETGFTKFTLEHTEGEPPSLLLWAGLGEQADHAWQALTLVALAFAPAGEPFTWQREREIVESE